MNGGMNILFLVALIGVMLFMTTRAQKKQRDTRSNMISKLKPGANVVTIGRLHGVVESVNEEEKTFTLDADGVFLVFDMDAIARVSEPKETTSVETTTQSFEEVKQDTQDTKEK